jgi:lipopolysaccharide transport protein LptA
MAIVPVAASAEKADRDKPMHIEADNLVHDELTQVSIFTGRAVLTKGTMVMRGARIEIREDADGYQFGVAFPEPNKRAFFRQKREGVDEFIEGEGLRIEYDGKADRVKLIDQAEVRRYRGVVLEAHVYTEREAELARLMPEKVAADTSKKLLCPMPGLVIAIQAVVGQEVKAGEPLAIVEAMKMENILRAERDVTIKAVNAKKGDSLQVDAVIMEFA